MSKIEKISDSDIRSKERHPLWNINLTRPLTYSSITWYQLNLTDAVLIPTKKIGAGTFGDVYKGLWERRKGDLKEVVIKFIKKSTDHDLVPEIKILETVNGGPNIVQFLFAAKRENARVAIVYELDSTETLLNNTWGMTESEVKHYSRQLLYAIQYCHWKGIIHRDIKPSNIIYNKARHTIQLCDFGNAIFYIFGKRNCLWGFSRGFEAPEVLLKDQYYDFSIDMWAFGCVIGAILMRRQRMFLPITAVEHLLSMTALLGKQKAINFIQKYGYVILPKHYEMVMSTPYLPLRARKHGNNRDLMNDLAINFIEKILCFDPRDRLLPEQALRHPWLAQPLTLRDLFGSDTSESTEHSDE